MRSEPSLTTQPPTQPRPRPRTQVLLDCDPGHDDAAAIIVAHAYTDLLAITTVSGNAPLAQTTRNALLISQLFNIDVPIASGAAHSLNGTVHHAPSIHGISGLDGPAHPPLVRATEQIDAVELILQLTRANEGAWIVATGPLTNIALALQRDPTLTKRIAGISLMGGSATFGNWTAAAEFNIWADPEAADLVFRCGAPLNMIGLNCTHEVLVTQRHVDELMKFDSVRSRFLAELYVYFRSTYQSAFTMPNAPLHDPCAVFAVSHPHLFDMRTKHVAIELDGRLTRGMTVVDDRGWGMGEPPNAFVAYQPQGEAILALVFAAATAHSP